MEKVIRLGSQRPCWAGRSFSTYCKIKINDGKLSITGVQGPMKSGNCRGSSGQSHDTIEQDGFTMYAPGWDRKTASKFFGIWRRWHLNDMRPCCEHMRDDGTCDAAREKVEVYGFVLDDETKDTLKEVRDRAKKALKSGKAFIPTAEESNAACLPTHLYQVNNPDAPAHYQQARPDGIYPKQVETKTRGWINYQDHPQHGILGKPCTVCGEKYGNKWYKEELPADVIEFLEALPETDMTPAWV